MLNFLIFMLYYILHVSLLITYFTFSHYWYVQFVTVFNIVKYFTPDLSTVKYSYIQFQQYMGVVNTTVEHN